MIQRSPHLRGGGIEEETNGGDMTNIIPSSPHYSINIYIFIRFIYIIYVYIIYGKTAEGGGRGIAPIFKYWG